MERRRGIKEASDDTLFPFKTELSLRTLVGTGVIVGAALSKLDDVPGYAPLALGVAMVAPTIAMFLLRRSGLFKDALEKRIVPGRKHAVIKGDFVVFHIGARANHKIDGFLNWMGQAMNKMQQELEENPQLGCLGIENYVGPTGTISVQYWRSQEQLNAWSRSATASHKSPWLKLAKTGFKSTNYAFWHETFLVKDGEYETIYVNCPPMLLGNARGVHLVDASGKRRTAAGRSGKSDGKDIPEDIRQELQGYIGESEDVKKD